MKQWITAIVAKVRRYQGRVDSYRQSRLFENNQRQFYRELDQKKDVMVISLWRKNGKSFGETGSQSADDKKDAKWLQDLRSKVNVKKQEEIDITTGTLKKILGRMPNWKSTGPELVQEFWLKNFSSLHER